MREEIPEEIMEELKAHEMKIVWLRKEPSKKSIRDSIVDMLKQKPRLEELRRFIEETDKLRNNLAHGNSSEKISEIKKHVKSLISTYERLCLGDDILA